MFWGNPTPTPASDLNDQAILREFLATVTINIDSDDSDDDVSSASE